MNFDNISELIRPATVSNIGESDAYTINIYMTPVELNPINDKLTYICQFKYLQDNWDGYNAKSPSEITIHNALNFIKMLPVNFQKTLNEEEIELSPYGTIILDWQKDDFNNISIEIGKSQIGFLSETEDGKSPYNESIPFDNKELPKAITEALQSLFEEK